jgi:quercetin dioxygenase-like cupin family protein
MKQASHWRFGIRLALVLVPVTLVLVPAFAQQQPQPAPPGQTANMTGKGGFVDSSDLHVSRIRFEPGARTYWHVHTTGQVLVAEEGQGLYQEQGGAIKKFVPGEAAYLKANVPHWHGAAANAPLVQATLYGGSLKWLGPVSDEDYSGTSKR